MDGDATSERIVSYLKELEDNAEQVLTKRSEMVELDRMRNNNRVAIRQLMKTKERKTWLAMGNTLFRFDTADAKKFLEEEQAKVEKTISETQQEMKHKVNKLRDIEGKPPLKGFNLKPLDQDELKVIYETMKK